MPDSFEFKRGYLLACTNMMNLHGDSVIARDTLNQVNITEAEVAAMDLAEYDAEGLAEIRAEAHGDPIRPNPTQHAIPGQETAVAEGANELIERAEPCGGDGREAVPADQVEAQERIWLRNGKVNLGQKCPFDDEYIRADIYKAQTARIQELEADNAILRAKAAGVVYICPECDIAGCRHVRAALHQ